jgi:uncharacterized protein (TIGR02246 family)
MKYLPSWLWILAWLALSSPAKAAEEEADEATHQELTTLRDEAVAALNKQDIDRLLEFVHPDVVFTAPYPKPGKEVRRGHAGVKAYFDEMFSGPNRRAESMTSEVKVDELSLLYGDDTAIAWGSSRDTYKMLDGTNFVVPARWSGTLVRQDGKWLIAEFHVSVNMFNNPLLEPAIKRTAWISGGIAAVVGMLLGAVAMLLLRRPGRTARRTAT